ncbi:MAG: ABC transporter permease [Bryobacteraceae bacterium]
MTAARTLRRSPAFAASIILAIALGTGANTALFSVIHSVVLKPLPFPEPQRLLALTEYYPQLKQSLVVSPVFLDWRDQTKTLERVAAYGLGDFTLTSGETAEKIQAGTVSHDFFPLLGVAPQIGRFFSPGDDRSGAARVAILSADLFQRRFGADPLVIGKSITLDGRPYQVIAVAPASFRFPQYVDMWLPLALDPVRERQGGMIQLIRVIGRMRHDKTIEAVAAELAAISQQTGRGMPSKPAGSQIRVVPLQEWMVGGLRNGWLVLMGSVFLILLIACSNIAGILLARAAFRRPEIAIRRALGAGTAHLVRQLLTESLVLTGAGALLGLLLAVWAVHAIHSIVPANLTAGRPLTLDATVLLFTALTATGVALFFGLAPALDLRRTRSVSRVRAAFVAAQVAFSFALLVAGIAMTRTLGRLQSTNLGFDATNLLTFSLQLPSSGYRQIDRQTAFFGTALDHLRATPGIRAVTFASAVPFAGAPPARAIITAQGENAWTPGQGERHRVEINFVDKSYWATFGIPFLEGRAFDHFDEAAQSTAVVINRSLRDRFFPGRLAAGQKIKLGFAEAPAPWLTIAGVVEDARYTALDQEPGPMIYRPYRTASSFRFATLALRSDSDPALLVESARRVIARLDRGVPLASAKTMEQRLSEWIAPQRLRALLLGALALLAVMMAASGLYGLIAYIAAQSRGPIAIRIALGATSGNILRMIVWRASALALAGLAAGLAVSWAGARFLATLLFGVSPMDPLSLFWAACLLLAVMLGASLAPAYRASQTDPMACLKQE